MFSLCFLCFHHWNYKNTIKALCFLCFLSFSGHIGRTPWEDTSGGHLGRTPREDTSLNDLESFKRRKKRCWNAPRWDPENIWELCISGSVETSERNGPTLQPGRFFLYRGEVRLVMREDISWRRELLVELYLARRWSGRGVCARQNLPKNFPFERKRPRLQPERFFVGKRTCLFNEVINFVCCAKM